MIGPVLALIPARSGSKRLPQKNKLLLGGLPLIEWSIRAAKASTRIDDVIVSTDDPEIAEIAVKAGARVPFMRPAHLATDEATSVDVVLHALAASETAYHGFVLLQPTSPFRTGKDIDGVLTMAEDRQADAVISVCEVDHSPLWTNTLPPDHSMAGFLKDDVRGVRSQQLPTYYRLNGSIYFCQ